MATASWIKCLLLYQFLGGGGGFVCPRIAQKWLIFCARVAKFFKTCQSPGDNPNASQIFRTLAKFWLGYLAINQIGPRYAPRLEIYIDWYIGSPRLAVLVPIYTKVLDLCWTFFLWSQSFFSSSDMLWDVLLFQGRFGSLFCICLRIHSLPILSPTRGISF